MVRFPMRLPSRLLSRSRMAGLEPRLGTKPIYTQSNIADLQGDYLSYSVALHGYTKRRRHAYRLLITHDRQPEFVTYNMLI